MKRLIWIFIGTATVIGLGFLIAGTGNHITQRTQTPQAASEVETQPTSQVKSRSLAESKSLDGAVASNNPQTTIEVVASIPPSATTAKTPVTDLILDQALDAVLSSQTSFEQKQTAWTQLRKAGKLDSAISQLEQRVTANPQSADSIAALGTAYYKKAGNTEDIRESAILAMKADKALEAALNLDPSNWDARYMRAAGMAHWPPELNKTKDVIEQFQSLIQDQESQAPQSHFAKSYLKLGEVYQKAGYAQYATEIWQRGSVLFPADSDLNEKLAASK